MGGWRDDDLADVCHRSVVVVFVSCRGISWNLTTVFPVPHSWTSRRGLTLSQRGREQRLDGGASVLIHTFTFQSTTICTLPRVDGLLGIMGDCVSHHQEWRTFKRK